MTAEVYDFTTARLNAYLPRPEVEKLLVRRGLSPDEAAEVVAAAARARSLALREAGARNMKLGALWCGGGVLVTVLTFVGADGGGTFILAWGAILFGGAQFCRGVSQYLSA